MGPANDLADGEEICMESRPLAGKPTPEGSPHRFVLRRFGQVYQCSCTHWRSMSMVAPEARTCAHLQDLRGENAELARIDRHRKLEFSKGSNPDGGGEILCQGPEPARLSPALDGGAASPSERTAAASAAPLGSPRSTEGATASMLWRGGARGLGSESSAPLTASSSRSLPTTEMHEQVGVPAHQVLSYDELTFGAIIGEGSFGVVRAAEWRGMLVAVKELRGNEKLVVTGSAASSGSNMLLDLNTDISPRDAAGAPEEWDLKHEAAMMSRVSNHENIVPFIGVLLTPRPCVVTKLMRRGSVEDLLVVPGPLYKRLRLSQESIVEMLIDAAAGILHLHSEGVIHRDIAARNLLVDENYRVRVADFGFARIKEINRSKGFTNTSVGPIKWMAPEAMRYRTFSEQSDVFSFGVTLFEVVAGRRPWHGVESMDVVYRICGGERLSISPQENCHPFLRELVQACQRHEPSERPSMREVHRGLVSLRPASNDLVDPGIGSIPARSGARAGRTPGYQDLPTPLGTTSLSQGDLPTVLQENDYVNF